MWREMASGKASLPDPGTGPKGTRSCSRVGPSRDPNRRPRSPRRRCNKKNQPRAGVGCRRSRQGKLQFERNTPHPSSFRWGRALLSWRDLPIQDIFFRSQTFRIAFRSCILSRFSGIPFLACCKFTAPFADLSRTGSAPKSGESISSTFRGPRRRRTPGHGRDGSAGDGSRKVGSGLDLPSQGPVAKQDTPGQKGSGLEPPFSQYARGPFRVMYARACHDTWRCRRSPGSSSRSVISSPGPEAGPTGSRT